MSAPGIRVAGGIVGGGVDVHPFSGLFEGLAAVPPGGVHFDSRLIAARSGVVLFVAHVSLISLLVREVLYRRVRWTRLLFEGVLDFLAGLLEVALRLVGL